MRKLLFRVFVMLALTVELTFGQSHQSSNLDQRLFYLCKAWGHVKYFHSAKAGENDFWDTQLLQSLKKVRELENDSEFDQLLFKMISDAGRPTDPVGPMPVLYDSLNNNSDLSWIRNDLFSDTTSSLLEFVNSSFRGYNSNLFGNGVAPNFDSDAGGYSISGLPNFEYRLLALFRYWNVIHYFFPYKNIMDQSWDSTLAEFIPRIVESQSAIDYHLTFRELTTRINDSHAFFSSPTFNNLNGQYYSPFLVKFIEGKTVVTEVPDHRLSIKVGDVILEIDGKKIGEARDSLRKYAAASNNAVIEREVNSMLLRGNQGKFKLVVDDGVNERELILSRGLTLTRSNISGDVVRKIQFENGCKVGIINTGLIKENKARQVFNDLKDTNYAIFDIRHYPEISAYSFMRFLFPNQTRFANTTRFDHRYPGRFEWNYISGGGGTNGYNGRIIILFDEGTQSAAEFSCMGLEQFPGAIKVGSTTAGADGNVSKIFLPGSIVTYATFVGVYYPDYTPTQRVGIVPDYFVQPTIEGIRAGRDEVLAFALSLTGCEPVRLISIYPNPAIDRFSFVLDDFTLGDSVLIELINSNGKPITKWKVYSKAGELDIADVPPGLYLIRVQKGESSYVVRLLKR